MPLSYMSPPQVVGADPTGFMVPLTPWMPSTNWKEVSWAYLLESCSVADVVETRLFVAYSRDRLVPVGELEPIQDSPTGPTPPGWLFSDAFKSVWTPNVESGLYLRFALEAKVGGVSPPERPIVLSRVTLRLQSHT